MYQMTVQNFVKCQIKCRTVQNNVVYKIILQEFSFMIKVMQWVFHAFNMSNALQQVTHTIENDDLAFWCVLRVKELARTNISLLV